MITIVFIITKLKIYRHYLIRTLLSLNFTPVNNYPIIKQLVINECNGQ